MLNIFFESFVMVVQQFWLLAEISMLANINFIFTLTPALALYLYYYYFVYSFLLQHSITLKFNCTFSIRTLCHNFHVFFLFITHYLIDNVHLYALFTRIFVLYLPYLPYLLRYTVI